MDTAAFNDLWAKSHSKIIKWVCGDCNEIRGENTYYKRLNSQLPDGFDMMSILLENFAQDNNVLGEDMGLYSTYDDAQSGENIWKFCNYGVVGFPRDCGPNDAVIDFQVIHVDRSTGDIMEELLYTDGNIYASDPRENWVLLLDTSPEDTTGGAFGGKKFFLVLPAADYAAQKGEDSSIFYFLLLVHNS